MINQFYNAATKIVGLSIIKGIKAKQQFIRENSNDTVFTRLLYYALNPMLSYKISEHTLRTHAGRHRSVRNEFGDIFDVLNVLASRKAVDDITIEQVQMFLFGVSPVEKDVYIRLIGKTLRLGVTAKSVNKIIPGLVPEWEVQQAYSINTHPIPAGEWFALSEKLNGVRATYYRGRLYARSGEEHKGLDHITRVLEEKIGTHVVFDGELTLLDRAGLSDNEAFRKATGIINADVGTVDKSIIGFTVFDALRADDFDAGVGPSYEDRRGILDVVYEPALRGTCVNVLPLLYSGTDQSTIPVFLDKMVGEDKEGLMANLDTPYQRKRHKGILKIKRFYTMDLPIVGFEEGEGRLIGTLGSIIADFKGNFVRVGTGLSDEDRRAIWQNKDNLLGLLCEVKYKEISRDKYSGFESLQFPVFVSLREDKETVSYE